MERGQSKHANFYSRSQNAVFRVYHQRLAPTDLALRLVTRANRRFQFHKSRYLFFRKHNETLSVVPMCVCNPDRSSVGINR
jgi:hypothetical protein